MGSVEAILGTLAKEEDVPTILSNHFLERKMVIEINDDEEEKLVPPIEYLDSALERAKNRIFTEKKTNLDGATDQGMEGERSVGAKTDIGSPEPGSIVDLILDFGSIDD